MLFPGGGCLLVDLILQLSFSNTQLPLDCAWSYSLPAKLTAPCVLEKVIKKVVTGSPLNCSPDLFLLIYTVICFKLIVFSVFLYFGMTLALQ